MRCEIDPVCSSNNSKKGTVSYVFATLRSKTAIIIAMTTDNNNNSLVLFNGRK